MKLQGHLGKPFWTNKLHARANHHFLGHRLRTPNEGVNQRNLKFWADVADKICFGHTYKFGIGIWFSAVQWRWFPHRESVVRVLDNRFVTVLSNSPKKTPKLDNWLSYSYSIYSRTRRNNLYYAYIYGVTLYRAGILLQGLLGGLVRYCVWGDLTWGIRSASAGLKWLESSRPASSSSSELPEGPLRVPLRRGVR